MTTRLKGFHVALDMDIREDDAESIQQAIQALRHVAAVTPIEASSDDFFVRARYHNEIVDKLLALIKSL